jgi:hypothetical protein
MNRLFFTNEFTFSAITEFHLQSAGNKLLVFVKYGTIRVNTKTSGMDVQESVLLADQERLCGGTNMGRSTVGSF